MRFVEQVERKEARVSEKVFSYCQLEEQAARSEPVESSSSTDAVDVPPWQKPTSGTWSETELMLGRGPI